MANGTYTPSDNLGWMTAQVSWESQADIAGNQSRLTVNLDVWGSSPQPNLAYTPNGTISVDGVTRTLTRKNLVFGYDASEKHRVFSESFTVPHDGDGTKTVQVAIMVRMDAALYHFGKVDDSRQIILDTIPRGAELEAVPDMELGQQAAFSWTPKAASHCYRLRLTMGEYSFEESGIQPGDTVPFGYLMQIPMEAAQAIPDSMTGEMAAELTTFSDAQCTQQVGSPSQRTFQVSVPRTMSPGVRLGVSPGGDLPEAFSGLYIQNKTPILAEVTGYPKYGAQIVETWVSPAEDYPLNGGYGQTQVFGYAKDSRGMTGGSIPLVIQILPYTKLQLLPYPGQEDVIAARCYASGEFADNGTFLRILARKAWSTVGGVNKCRLEYRLKAEAAGTWGEWTQILERDSAANQVDTGAISAAMLASNSYRVEVRAVDDLGETAVRSFRIPTDRVYMHRDPRRRALAIGKMIEEDNAVDIEEDIALILRGGLQLLGESRTAVLDIAHPVGSILTTNTQTNPGESIGGTWELISGTQYQWARTQ